jgi:two-component system, LytTR family, sensor kinase
MFNRRWIRHLIFWIAWLFAMTIYFIGPEYSKFIKILIYMIAGMPVFLTYSYISSYIIIPYCFHSERFLILIPYFIFGGIIFSVLYTTSVNFLYYKVFDPAKIISSDYFDYQSMANNMVRINLAFLMFGSAKLIRDYLVELNKKNEIETKNIEAEISFLATQLHPHFLFNTLNNLYSLALSNSPKTSISLQKIKGLMAYILYECGQPEISLKKEINLIDDYLELEKLRYDGRLKVNFENSVENYELLIAPMILFTFVENCFKHGSSKSMGKSYINIKVSTNENKLLFYSENSIPEIKTKNKNERNGLGLENAKKRLNFLYPNCHNLNISQEKDRFMVELIIDDLNNVNNYPINKEFTEKV